MLKYHLRGDIVRACDDMIKAWPHSEFGPAHIVLSDYNLDDESILFCLGWMDITLNGEGIPLENRGDKWHEYVNGWRSRSSRREHMIVQEFLRRLLAIPESIRVSEEQIDVT